MKAPLIQIKNLHISVSTFLPEQLAASASFLELGAFMPAAPATPACSALTPPAIGDYWPGQGGLYGGLRHYPEGLCHIIFAANDVGRHAYGEHGTSVEATSNIDGRENTAVLVNRDGSHPAADAAYAYTCDGHNDFYLPASGELHHGYLYLPESFEKALYISSTQRSAYYAYSMDFEDGRLNTSVKLNERLARPVRRILQ
ncbi:DUF1566 domain-containing protein [Pseudomonas proteolytica]|nr:DUF1566 domain-containing protein [Pseudomonas proteolytica]USW94992.1 DUF1566 domain-containing protein [Pseudomonas proteolytica]USX00976.1 DUF1566 domain-containing protein [Pseudomonas proteolytica]